MRVKSADPAFANPLARRQTTRRIRMSRPMQLQQRVLSMWLIWPRTSLAFRYSEKSCLHNDSSAIRHGISRVDEKIGNNLIKLTVTPPKELTIMGIRFQLNGFFDGRRTLISGLCHILIIVGTSHNKVVLAIPIEISGNHTATCFE